MTTTETKSSQIMFAGEMYEYIEYTDNSKLLHKEKNNRGFKISIKISGNSAEHKEGMQALKEFFVKASL